MSEPEVLWSGQEGADEVRVVLDEVAVGLHARAVHDHPVVEVLDGERWRATSLESAHRVAGVLARELRDLRAAARALLSEVVTEPLELYSGLRYGAECSLCNVVDGHTPDCVAGRLAALLPDAQPQEPTP